ncbi:protein E6-like [Cucumis melo var. makuwa]|uniref:Protein E6-like n=2 Tax=Cucumis melo TaxID=3656 RepID=A0A1S3C0L5_CUCME|nr:protein E6-like [Cucumis melo]TYK21625.1 protein E6-like [Cucumis melo var. makuwa]
MAAASASTTFNFNHLSFFFLLLLSSVQTEARVNKFFSKFIHTDHEEVVPNTLSPAPLSVPPETSPSLAPTPAPAPFFDESQNAYGLYGSDPDTDENPRTITDVEEEILGGEGDQDETNRKSEFPMNNFVQTRDDEEQYQNKNYEYNNGFRNSEYENHNEYRNSEYENNNNEGRNYQYQSNFEDGGYRRSRFEPTEQQGMSDTRFMENGRYFHDINSKNDEENGSYGSKKKYPKYEFDSMEEYERSEGLLP